ncbi:ion channel [Oceanospirillum maris]|uniref:ion channel n=1 Tax=Oceanospirillum maris TaxID=64977 RepID=UPI00040FD281|nr:ion channel [Oceanospirillum maris]
MASALKSTSFLGRWLGLAGVSADENPRARLWAQRLEWPMLFMALWMLIAWYLSLMGDIHQLLHRLSDLLIWFFFLAETLLLTFLVDRRRVYLKRNWMNIVILVLGLPILWGDSSMAIVLRMLRVVLILSLLMPMSSTIHAILARNNLGTTLLISAIFVGLSGTFISVIDPAIDSPWEGIWWALVTVTTVGYGDVVPSSATGKFFATILILLGIGLLSLLTASFSVFFLSQEEEGVIDKEAELLKRVDRVASRLDRLEDSIARVLECQRQILKQQEAQKQDACEPPESDAKMVDVTKDQRS